MDPDPAIVVTDLQKFFFSAYFFLKAHLHHFSKINMPTKHKFFFCLFLFEGTFTSFFKDQKFKKKSQKSRNEGFAYYF
jgi:hypothetical protein